MILRTCKLSLLYGAYWMTSCMIYSCAERFLLHCGFTTGRIGGGVTTAYLAAMLL